MSIKKLHEFMYNGMTNKGKDERIVYLGNHPSYGLVTNCISTGAPNLDRIIAKDIKGRWGIPCGRTSFVSGKPGCLSGDTLLLVKSGKNGGRYYTLEDVYHKLNHIRRDTVPGKNVNRWWSKEIQLPSLCEDGAINNSKVISIVRSGVKTTYTLKTKTGRKIRATVDHRFKVLWNDDRVDDEGFVKLGDLEIGDTILCKNTNCESNGRLQYRKNGNNLVIHHKDGNHHNDSLENLEVMTKKVHDQLHGKDLKTNFSNQIPHEDIVESIKIYGEEETYDVIMDDPNHNFVANEFIVHNSGKTTLCHHLCAETQQRGGIAYFIDSEHRIDEEYAKKIGVNVKDLLYFAPETLEDVLGSIDKAIETVKAIRKTGEFEKELKDIPILIITDSLNIATRSEKEGEIGKGSKGEHARLMSEFLRKITPDISNLNIAILFVCQIKSKLNMGYGGRGPKETFLAEDTLRFHCTIGLRAQRISTLRNKNNDRYADIDLYVTTKNSCLPPFREAEIELHYGKGFNYYTSVTDTLLEYYNAEVKGSWYNHPGIGKWQGKDGIRKLIEKDAKIQRAINKVLSSPMKIEV